MSDFGRRQFLKGLLGILAQAAGSVVVASAAAEKARAQEHPPDGSETPPEDIQDRADRLAATGQSLSEDSAGELIEFLNGAFRNTPLGSFANGPVRGFRNTPIGSFRNAPIGSFRNTPLGSFANGGWPNGGWGGFGNGGWPNRGWGNW